MNIVKSSIVCISICNCISVVFVFVILFTFVFVFVARVGVSPISADLVSVDPDLAQLVSPVDMWHPSPHDDDGDDNGDDYDDDDIDYNYDDTNNENGWVNDRPRDDGTLWRV